MKYLKNSLSLNYNLGLISKYRLEIMGLATIFIICCHANAVHPIDAPAIVKRILSFGNIGVEIFLFMSGVSMYYSLAENCTLSVKLWYFKRYTRLLFPYLAIAVPYFAIYTIYQNETILDYIKYTSTYTYWTDHFGFWYIAMLLPLYLVTPLYSKIIEKNPYRMFTTLCFCIFVLLLSRIPAIKVSVDNVCVIENIQFILQRLPAFFIGYYIGPLVKKNHKISITKVLIMSIICLGIIKLVFPTKTHWAYLEIIPLIAFFTTIIKYKGGTFFVFFGKMSLESYLSNSALIVLIGLIPWNVFKTGINKGNFLHYVLVIILGVLWSYIVNLVINKTTSVHENLLTIPLFQ